MDARVSPALFPVIEICLRLFQALEALALERRLLCVGDTRLDFAFSIGIAHPARQRCHTVVRQHIAIERIQTGIVDVGSQNAFAKIIENDDRGQPPNRRNAFSCNSAQMRELDRNVSSRTDLRL